MSTLRAPAGARPLPLLRDLPAAGDGPGPVQHRGGPPGRRRHRPRLPRDPPRHGEDPGRQRRAPPGPRDPQRRPGGGGGAAAAHPRPHPRPGRRAARHPGPHRGGRRDDGGGGGGGRHRRRRRHPHRRPVPADRRGPAAAGEPDAAAPAPTAPTGTRPGRGGGPAAGRRRCRGLRADGAAAVHDPRDGGAGAPAQRRPRQTGGAGGGAQDGTGEKQVEEKELPEGSAEKAMRTTEVEAGRGGEDEVAEQAASEDQDGPPGTADGQTQDADGGRVPTHPSRRASGTSPSRRRTRGRRTSASRSSSTTSGTTRSRTTAPPGAPSPSTARPAPRRGSSRRRSMSSAGSSPRSGATSS